MKAEIPNEKITRGEKNACRARTVISWELAKADTLDKRHRWFTEFSQPGQWDFGDPKALAWWEG